MASLVLSRAMQCYRREAWSVTIFSIAINLLMLTGSLYMLQVYDRVLASQSIPTLVALSALALGAFALQGVLDAVRLRMLSRLAAQFDEQVAPSVARAGIVLPLRGAGAADAMQPHRDAETIRSFLSGSGPTALIDLPFMPIFMVGCFILHPWLGWLTVCGGVIILALTLWVEWRSHGPARAAARSQGDQQAAMESARSNAGVIQALGMRPAIERRLGRLHEAAVVDSLKAGDSMASIGAVARTFRFVLQSAVLGLGAFLAIRGDVSAGVIIAASIMTSRALAPVELAVANWKGFVATRQSLGRLALVLPLVENRPSPAALPAPRHVLEVRDLSVSVPGCADPVVRGASFSLRAGEGLALIGPSGAGKSTLARALAGIDTALRGKIALDGAALDQWDPDTRGQHVGYLPQDVDLLDGSIAENIARFSDSFSMDDVIKAARLAGAHEMIVALPRGYDTVVGEAGGRLSGGQRQRIALARAVYGEPFLVILDEPNANLDQQGDEALNGAIRQLRANGSAVIVVTHRPAGLAAVELIGVMEEGRLVEIGPKDQVLERVLRHTGRSMQRSAPQRTAPHQMAAGTAS
jgi:ATP-binding cassette subfamily C protein PrsD